MFIFQQKGVTDVYTLFITDGFAVSEFICYSNLNYAHDLHRAL